MKELPHLAARPFQGKRILRKGRENEHGHWAIEDYTFV